jgi:hypothetical protein
MSRVKDLYIEQHEKAMADYLEAHPEASDEEAYDSTAQAAHERLTDYYADMADHYRDMAKERGE